jgi:hypothetical protein
MIKRWIPAGLFLMLVQVTYAETMVHNTPEPYDLQVQNPHFVIVHAEILNLGSPITTPAKPAQGRIRIHKVLRGRNLKAPRDVDATFGAPALPGIPSTIEFRMPPVGSQVMVSYCCLDLAGKYADENTVSTQNYLVLWTPENEARVTGSIAPKEATGQRQGSLLLVLLLTTLAGFASGIFRIPAKKKIVLRTLLFASSFLIYAFYERGISIQTNIRVDLLMLYPMLLANGAGLCWVAWSYFQRGTAYPPSQSALPPNASDVQISATAYSIAWLLVLLVGSRLIFGGFLLWTSLSHWISTSFFVYQLRMIAPSLFAFIGAVFLIRRKRIASVFFITAVVVSVVSNLWSHKIPLLLFGSFTNKLAGRMELVEVLVYTCLAFYMWKKQPVT